MRILGYNINAAPAKPRTMQGQLKQNSVMSGAFRTMGGWFRQLFTTFQGNRNVYKVYGYKNELTYQDGLGKYLRQDVAKRVVKLPADAIWANPPSVTGDATVQKVLDDLVRRLNLWQVLNRADRVAGMAKYCALLIGVDDGRPLDLAVSSSRTNKVTFLQPYAADNATVAEWVTDPTDPRFGKPLMYNIPVSSAFSMGQGNTAFANPSGGRTLPSTPVGIPSRVHWTRMIHIVEDPLEDTVFGSPRLQNVYNLMDDFLKVGGGSAEVYWLNSRGGLHINVDKEMDMEDGDEDNLSEEIDDYTNNLRRFIRTRGVDVNAINMKITDPRQTFEVLLSLLAAATGIPQRMLVGTEAGQLASEQDRANWAVATEERRANFAEPFVLGPLLAQLALLGLFTVEQAQKCVIKWPGAFKLSPLERAQTSAQQARSVANCIKGLGTPATPGTDATTSPDGQVTPGMPGDPGAPGVISIEEARTIIFMGTLDPDDVGKKVPDNYAGMPQPSATPTGP